MSLGMFRLPPCPGDTYMPLPFTPIQKMDQSSRTIIVLEVLTALITHAWLKSHDPVPLSKATLALAGLPFLPLCHLFSQRALVTFLEVGCAYSVFYATLSCSVIAYRLSPFHPLAKYPGPIVLKVTKLWSVWIAYTGKNHVYFKALHDRYGPTVRIGPNELSTIERDLIPEVLGTQGMPKGPIWDGRRFGQSNADALKNYNSLIDMRDSTIHARLRKPWNKSFAAGPLQDYERLLLPRITQLNQHLANHIRKSVYGAGHVDIAQWINFFSCGVIQKSQDSSQEYVQACVHCARSRPLILTHEPRFFGDGILPLVFEATRNCSWKALNVATPSFQPVIDMLASNSRDTLTSLTLKCALPRHNHPLLLRKISCLRQLSRLKINFCTTINSTTFDAPWSKLTHLSISCREANDETILGCLRQCSNLEEFAFNSGNVQFTSPGTSDTPIYRPKLRKLHLSGNPNLFTKVANVVVTPHLQGLLLDGRNFSFVLRSSFSLCQYLVTSAKTLCSLWISGITTTEIEEIIPQLERLEDLTLMCNDEVHEGSFRSLEVQDSSQSVSPNDNDQDLFETITPLPRLLALRIICSVTPYIQASFLKIVQSRWWSIDDDPTQTRAVSRLRHATLQERVPRHGYTVYIDRTASELDRLRKAGLDVNVRLDNDRDHLTARFILSS